MKVVELYPGNISLDIDPNITELSEAKIWYPRILGSRFNYVISIATEQGKNSHDVSSPLDRYFLRAIRSASDLIITTGKTARSENLRSSKLAPLAIFTSRPDEIDIPATLDESTNPVIIASQVKPTRRYPNSHLLFEPIEAKDSPSAFAELTEKLMSASPLFEVGITTALELCRADLLDEICLTITGKVSVFDAKVLAQEFLNGLHCKAELIHLLEADENFFFRFEVLKQTL